jgi:hypothetical protein
MILCVFVYLVSFECGSGDYVLRFVLRFEEHVIWMRCVRVKGKMVFSFREKI